MQAQMLLDRKAARVPNTTAQAMQKAFDEAWQKVSPLSGGNQRAIEADRLTLAECVVTVTGDGTTDVEAIKRLALDMMQIVNRRW